MKNLLKMFKNSKDNSGQTDISPEVVSNAYKTREKEIESLRKYDRGEKTITPANLKSIVRGI